MKFKQVLMLIAIVEVYIFLLVGAIKLLTPDKPKPFTESELRHLSDTCTQCTDIILEAGIIEPNK